MAGAGCCQDEMVHSLVDLLAPAVAAVVVAAAAVVAVVVVAAAEHVVQGVGVVVPCSASTRAGNQSLEAGVAAVAGREETDRMHTFLRTSVGAGRVSGVLDDLGQAALLLGVQFSARGVVGKRWRHLRLTW